MLEVLPYIYAIIWIVLGGLSIAALGYVVAILKRLFSVVQTIDETAKTASQTAAHIAAPIQALSGSLVSVTAGVKAVEALTSFFKPKSKEYND